jgi:hypothetical protein
MNSSDKELELLRQANKNLSNSFSRFALICLAIYGFIAFTFAHAFKQIDDKSITEKLQKINEFSDTTKETAWSLKAHPLGEFFLLNYFFEPTQSVRDIKNWRNITIRLFRSYPEPIKNEQKDLSIKKDEALLLQKKNAEEIRKIYNDAFKTELGFSGVKIPFDLRNWLPILPLFLLISIVYLYILRKKIKLINMAISHIVQNIKKSNPDSVTTLDILTFSDNPFSTTEYSRHPRQLLEYLYMASIVWVTIYFLFILMPILKNISFIVNIVFFPFIFLSIYYAIAYSLYVSTRLQRQFETQLGLIYSLNFFIKFFKKYKERYQQMAAQVKPRLLLTSGSLLTLLTLFLAMSISTDGCNKRTISGYDIVIGKNESKSGFGVNIKSDGSSNAQQEDIGGLRIIDESIKTPWITVFSESLFESSENYYKFVQFHQTLARIVYTVSLLLAVVTVLLVIISFKKIKIFLNKHFNTWLFKISGATSLFFIADLDFILITPPLKIIVLIIYYLIPIILWFYLGFSVKESKNNRWVRWHNILFFLVILPLFLLLPFLFISLIILSVVTGVKLALGTISLLVGTQLISFGYMQLYRNS